MSFRSQDPFGDRLDFERLRAVQSRFVSTGPVSANDSLPSFLGQVSSEQKNIKVGQFCRVVPTVVLGQELEGGAGTFAGAGQSSGSSPILVYLLGSSAPLTGDYLVCRFVDHRWVAETSGGGTTQGSGITIPSCYCLVPATLQMVSAAPKCNYEMFQSCSLQYGPSPPALVSSGIQSNSFTSGAMFTDPSTGSKFFYYFWCMYNQFYLTRIFPTSPFGSPYRDAILYSWVVGGYGNNCQPFALTNGSAYPGSDAACSVSIYGG